MNHVHDFDVGTLRCACGQALLQMGSTGGALTPGVNVKTWGANLEMNPQGTASRITDLEARLAASESIKRQALERCDEMVSELLDLRKEREASCGYKHGWVPVLDETMRTFKWARAQALQEAAKVASMMITGETKICCTLLAMDIAYAIRALASDPIAPHQPHDKADDRKNPQD